MSDYEVHLGKMREIPRLDENETIEEMMARLLIMRGKKHFESGDIKDHFTSEFHRSGIYYYEKGEKIFEIEDREFEDEDVNLAYRNKNGDIEYALRFYNGGTCLPEMLDYALDQMFKKEADENQP